MCGAECTAPRPAGSGWISTNGPLPTPSRPAGMPRARSGNGIMGCSIRIIRTGAALRSITGFAQGIGAITSARRWNTMAVLCRAKDFASMISPIKRWRSWSAVTRRVNRSLPIYRTTRRTRRCRCRIGGGTSSRTRRSSCATAIRAGRIWRICAVPWRCARISTGTSDASSRSLINSAWPRTPSCCSSTTTARMACVGMAA